MAEVAIIGAGLIGRAWAIVFARAGWSVQVTDVDAATLAEVPALVRAGMDELHRHGLLDDVDTAMAKITTCPNVASAVRNADLVQENGPEREDVKASIFAELDRHAPPTAILASSSSAIVSSRFTHALAGRGRCLIAHPVNPPHLVPVVELCGSPWTSPEVLERAKAIYEEIGQIPVVVNRELEGFVLNRLQGALLAEAFRLVGEGVISPADLDKTVKDGLGLRWSFMGPFETIDLNAPGGIDDYCRRYTDFYRRLSEDAAEPSVWDRPNVDRILGAWGAASNSASRRERSNWRDARLAALQAHKHSLGGV
ncbi:3-hydroxyacyl-CoA dehydrogenase [Microvirga antarctica]|uniref:3-hydroxyacyl-CoA dehydrogenase n=1 Tax=Microvirga antarctica TaxID=2819233 RepID=UPI001B3115CB|nr:3-hydroxyacyl-CoA dehydrogenase [Microvirga antarctica]